MKYSPYDQSYTNYERWHSLIEPGTYHRVEPSALKGLLPQSLLDKTNSILAMTSASGDKVVFHLNINRVDAPASAIDQQPYIVSFDLATSAVQGFFTDHGNWTCRTTPQSQHFFDYISASGTGCYFPQPQMPTSVSGLINELSIPSQIDAWSASVSGLRSLYWDSFSTD